MTERDSGPVSCWDKGLDLVWHSQGPVPPPWLGGSPLVLREVDAATLTGHHDLFSAPPCLWQVPGPSP